MDLAQRGPLGQRPPRLFHGTVAGRAHMHRVKQLPCVICRKPPPSAAHHVFHERYGSRKASDFETIPLCWACHQGPDGVHEAKETWALINGFDFEFLAVVADQLTGEFNWGKDAP